jgi:4-amino-4-deoxy-L-arabinose transferase-like glycosyltransferase
VSALLADPLSPASPPHADARRPRRRWEVWRSPDDQPRWARPVLLAIAAVAAALFAWNIADAGLAPFYSVAVKSMSESWKAFFYGAFDPKATITIDKLAGSFLPQALSARIFGFHAWSLALPQVIEGVVSVLVMYRMVRRWAGAVAGILAALIFALTPIAASMFGHSMEDGALTMCLVLAADAWTRSVLEGRLRSLLWAGFWIGVGFQCKMLQAWMALPALILAYLLCASGPLLRRVRDLVLFGVVTLGVSLSWILLYTFNPAADRPYIDGSTNNSAWSMVFGYNGLERFGISVPGAVTSGPGVTTGGAATGTATGGEQAADALRQAGGSAGGFGHVTSAFGSGWTKLFGSEFGPQIGWLFPLALLAIICSVAWTWRTPRTDQTKAGFVFWGVWFVTFFLIFNKMSNIPHTAYVASLAPAIAALSAAGIVMFWRAYRFHRAARLDASGVRGAVPRLGGVPLAVLQRLPTVGAVGGRGRRRRRARHHDLGPPVAAGGAAGRDRRAHRRHRGDAGGARDVGGFSARRVVRRQLLQRHCGTEFQRGLRRARRRGSWIRQRGTGCRLRRTRRI